MKKEKLIELGLTEEQANSIIELHKTEISGSFIPKSRFDEVNGQLTKVKEDIVTRDKQLEELKKVNVEELKSTIETLQSENKQKDDAYKAEIQELKISNAIKLALGDKVHDAELVAGLFDKTKLVLKEDGTVAGIDEQYKGLQESKSFLFKEEVEKTLKGAKPAEGKGGLPEKKVSEMNYAEMCAYLEANPDAEF